MIKSSLLEQILPLAHACGGLQGPLDLLPYSQEKYLAFGQ
jgi:hypothetical protein